jgi:hypothetical protein
VTEIERHRAPEGDLTVPSAEGHLHPSAGLVGGYQAETVLRSRGLWRDAARETLRKASARVGIVPCCWPWCSSPCSHR